jgi:hypothetical protein
MRHLIRAPLTWLVIAEFVVVGALVILVWSAVGAAGNPVLASPSVQQPDPSAESSASPAPGQSGVTRPSQGPMAGLNTNSYFWRVRLAELNREQAYLEQLEWQVVHSAMDALQRYLDTVVIPSIQRAERAGGRSVSA